MRRDPLSWSPFWPSGTSDGELIDGADVPIRTLQRRSDGSGIEVSNPRIGD